MLVSLTDFPEKSNSAKMSASNTHSSLFDTQLLIKFMLFVIVWFNANARIETASYDKGGMKGSR